MCGTAKSSIQATLTYEDYFCIFVLKSGKHSL